jgi:hypothetical protein
MLLNKKTFASYTAGLFDGEGCIRHTGKTEHVFITSCFPHHLALIQKHFGCGTLRKMLRSQSNYRTAYRLEFYGKSAIGFLEEIGPFLIEKAYQANILLSIRSLPPRSAARETAMAELKKAKKIEYGSARP